LQKQIETRNVDVTCFLFFDPGLIVKSYKMEIIGKNLKKQQPE